MDHDYISSLGAPSLPFITGAFGRLWSAPYKKILIVGAGWAGTTLAQAIKNKSHTGIGFAGFIDDKFSDSFKEVMLADKSTAPVLGTCKDLYAIALQYKADCVITAINQERSDTILAQLVNCYESGIPFFDMPDFYSELTGKIPLQHVEDHWILPKLESPPHNFYTLFHDVTNYFFSAIGSLFFLILLPVIALLIKLDSKGPIFYRQTRIGLNHNPFLVIKFRTMYADAEKHGAVWATKNDDRITRIGRFLRKSRMDEIPQFLNVLKGEMSLIGPRPERPEFVENLAKEIPFYNYRHLVRPGISGWAQINYRYGNTIEDTLQKLQYDLYWIKNRSIWLDVKIIFHSLKVMITGFGAV